MILIKEIQNLLAKRKMTFLLKELSMIQEKSNMKVIPQIQRALKRSKILIKVLSKKIFKIMRSIEHQLDQILSRFLDQEPNKILKVIIMITISELPNFDKKIIQSVYYLSLNIQ